MQSVRLFMARPLTLAIAVALSGTSGIADAAPAKKRKVSASRIVKRAAPAVTAGVQRPVGQVYLSQGRGQLITMPVPISDVFIANDTVADVKVQSPTKVFLFGKALGETSFYAVTESGQVVYSTNVFVSQNRNSIDEVLKSSFPDSSMSVVYAGQSAILTGTAANPEDATMAVAVVTTQLNPGINTSDPNALLQVPVINRLKIAMPMQVSLQVRIAEVNRSFSRNLGVNWKNQTNASQGTRFNVQTGRDPGTISTTSPTTFSFAKGGEYASIGIGLPNFLGSNVLGALDAGEREGFVTTLASPTLTSISGQEAQFLVGGEIPIPVSTSVGNGAIVESVTFRNYGTKLQFTPKVLADGRISLKVAPEVSELDYSNAYTPRGSNSPVPGSTTRKVETTVELGSGQSFVIGGLMRASNSNAVNRLPGAGNLPILGSLFRSTAYQRGETELMIVVTPYLVRPVSANQIVLPTDGYQAPNEAERLLMGEMYKGSNARRPSATMAPPKTVGPDATSSGSAPGISGVTKPDMIAPGFGN